jgi:hypothetical protein
MTSAMLDRLQRLVWVLSGACFIYVAVCWWLSSVTPNTARIGLPMINITGIGVLVDSQVVVANSSDGTVELFDRSGRLLYQRLFYWDGGPRFRLFVCNADSEFAINVPFWHGPDSTFIGIPVGDRVIVRGMPYLAGGPPGCRDAGTNVDALKRFLPHRLWLESPMLFFGVAAVTVVMGMVVARRRRDLAYDDAILRRRGEADRPDDARPGP